MQTRGAFGRTGRSVHGALSSVMRSSTAVGATAGLQAESKGALWAGALCLVLAVGGLYRSVLPAWLQDLWMDPDYSHGLLVPFVSVWLAYERRERVMALPSDPAPSAILLVLGSLGLFVVGVLAAELFVTRFSLLVLIASLTAFIFGFGHLRALALPIGFLVFMVPLPALVFNAVALPLQMMASQLAVTTLQALGVPALREGNIIFLPNAALEVVEACSGLRSVISLGATSVLLAALSLRTLPWRLALVASSVLVAVLANGARVAGTGVLAYRYGPAAAQGFFHSFSGWIVFVTAVGAVALEAVVFRRLEQR